MINIRSFNTHIFALIFIILITILLITLFELVKPDNITRQFNYDAFPKIKPSDLPDPTLATGSSCLNSLKKCDYDIDCGDCGENFKCTETEEEHIIDGIRVPQGKFCLPGKKDYAKCNNYTGKWVWTAEGGIQDWKCECRYPNLYGDSDSGCTKQIACGEDSGIKLKFQNDANSDSKYTYKKGDVWDPVNSESENLSVNPFSTFKDSSGVIFPLLACDCSNGQVKLPNDPYVCHPDYCTSYKGNQIDLGAQAAIIDKNGYATGECDCNNTVVGNKTQKLNTIPYGKLRGFCYNQDRICENGTFEAETGLCNYLSPGMKNRSDINSSQDTIVVQCNSENVVWETANNLCNTNPQLCKFPSIAPFDENTPREDLIKEVENEGGLGGDNCEILRQNYLQAVDGSLVSVPYNLSIDPSINCPVIGAGQPWRCRKLSNDSCISTMCSDPDNPIGIEQVKICNESSYNNNNLSPGVQKMLGTNDTIAKSYPNLNIMTGVSNITDDNGRFKGCKAGTFLPGSSVLEDIKTGFRGYSVSCPQFEQVDCGMSFNNDNIINDDGKPFTNDVQSCFGKHKETINTGPGVGPGPGPGVGLDSDPIKQSRDCAGNIINTQNITALPKATNFSCRSGDVNPVYPPGTVVSRLGSNLNSVQGQIKSWNITMIPNPQGAPPTCEDDGTSKPFNFCQPLNNPKDNESIDNLLEKTNFGCNMQGFNNVDKNMNPDSLCLFGTVSKTTNKAFDNDISSPGFGDGTKISTPNLGTVNMDTGDCEGTKAPLPVDTNIRTALTTEPRKDSWKGDTGTAVGYSIVGEMKSGCEQGSDNNKSTDGGPVLNDTTFLGNTAKTSNKNSTMTNLLSCESVPEDQPACFGSDIYWVVAPPPCKDRKRATECLKNEHCVWGYCHPKTMWDKHHCAQWNRHSINDKPADSDYFRTKCEAQKNFAGVKQCDWKGP